MKIYAISNQKGGVGKTTTAINLSCSMASATRSVLLVDLDPQGNSTSGLGMNKGERIGSYEVLIGDAPIRNAILQTCVPNMHLLPSGINLAGAEIQLVSQVGREQLLKNALADVAGEYEYVFIDCPPSLGLLTLNALTAADAVLVPIQCEFFALEGLGQLMNTVKLMKKHLNPMLELAGIICTMYDNRTNMSNQVINELKKHFGDKVFDTCIPRNIRLAEAPSYGLPVQKYDASCSGAQKYRELAAELLKRNEQKG